MSPNAAPPAAATAVTARMMAARARRRKGRRMRPGSSVHHPVVAVVLELDQVVGGITKDERQVLLDLVPEAGRDRLENTEPAGLGEPDHRVEVVPAPKGHAEVARVELRVRVDLRREMA